MDPCICMNRLIHYLNNRSLEKCDIENKNALNSVKGIKSVYILIMLEDSNTKFIGLTSMKAGLMAVQQILQNHPGVKPSIESISLQNLPTPRNKI